MKDSKVLLYMGSLDKHGINRLERFLVSPCNHVYPNVFRLFQILKKDHPNYNEAEKENIFQQLFPGKKFSQQELGNNLKYLSNAIEDFLVIDQLNKKEELKALLLTERLRYSPRKLHRDAIAKYELAFANNSVSDTAEYFFHNYQLHHEKDIYFSVSETREDNNEIQLKNNALDAWFATQKLKTWCEMLNRQNIVSAKYEFTLQKELLDFINKNGKQIFNHPSVEIFYTIYLTLTEPEKESHFKKLLLLLAEHELVIARAELRSMYDFAQNYCIKKLNSGNTSYAEELFVLYDQLLKKKLMLSDEGKLSPWDYKNIVTLSLRLKKEKWCLDFIERYKVFLPRAESENAYRYNLAYYHAAVENFREAKKLLQRVEFNDPFYQLGSKSILLRCYYELVDEESFLSHCDSFKKLLTRNKTISDYQRNVHLNLITWTKKTFRVMMRRMENSKNVSKKEIEHLKSRIQSVKQINNLAWLLEKVEEIV